MGDFFDKVKSGAGKLKKNATKVTKQVVRKTNDAVSQTKLNFAINETESKISEIYEEMGRNVYRKYLKDGDVCESMQESCSSIDKLFAEIDDLKEKVAELKHSIKCPKCGDYNNSGSAYCSSCGERLNDDSEEEEVPDSVNDVDDEIESETEETVERSKRVVTIRARKSASQED